MPTNLTEDMPDRIYAWNFLKDKQDYVMKGGWDDMPDRKIDEYVRGDIHASVVAERDSLAAALALFMGVAPSDVTAALVES